MLEFPKNALVAAVSPAADCNVVNNLVSYSSFVFPDWSVNVPAGITTFTWSLSIGIPVSVIVYWTPYCLVDVTPSTVTDSSNLVAVLNAGLTKLVMSVGVVPVYAYTFIFPAVNELLA